VPVQARRAVDDGSDLVLAAGGDGTVLGVLRGIRGTEVALGVLPLGTANDFARSLGVPDDRRALAALGQGRVRPIDLIACQYTDEAGARREDAICSSAGLGFTAQLTYMERSASMQTLKRRAGSFAFVLASARLLLTYTGTWVREIGKVARIGAMPLLPRARADSGTLDMCVFDGRTRRAAWLLLNLQLSERHLGWPDYHYFTGARAVEMVPEGPMPLHLHGEPAGWGPVRFEVCPGAQAALCLPRSG
jgi:diacylglycerol kinase (ATP)